MYTYPIRISVFRPSFLTSLKTFFNFATFIHAISLIIIHHSHRTATPRFRFLFTSNRCCSVGRAEYFTGILLKERERERDKNSNMSKPFHRVSRLQMPSKYSPYYKEAQTMKKSSKSKRINCSNPSKLCTVNPTMNYML